jgi:hypothetical protein
MKCPGILLLIKYSFATQESMQSHWKKVDSPFQSVNKKSTLKGKGGFFTKSVRFLLAKGGWFVKYYSVVLFAGSPPNKTMETALTDY